ncbi:hypothetical protein CRE_00321 [Caenorhabditis remanei]|uniref:Uncharacterized protein n=1 Tax=Caenorhabditis remanei TaxID=31234 RepID=E3LEI1_CAERE|nr:hypothetical protein CRE_00321 [Caenorhabditis remanei]
MMTSQTLLFAFLAALLVVALLIVFILLEEYGFCSGTGRHTRLHGTEDSSTKREENPVVEIEMTEFNRISEDDIEQ